MNIGSTRPTNSLLGIGAQHITPSEEFGLQAGFDRASALLGEGALGLVPEQHLLLLVRGVLDGEHHLAGLAGAERVADSLLAGPHLLALPDDDGVGALVGRHKLLVVHLPAQHRHQVPCQGGISLDHNQNMSDKPT